MKIDKKVLKKYWQKVVGAVIFMAALVAIIEFLYPKYSEGAEGIQVTGDNNTTVSGENNIVIAGDNNTINEQKNEENYKIYLSSEYRKVRLFAETKMTIRTEFEADEVELFAIYPTGEKSDVMEVDRRDKNEWSINVYFNKVGMFTVKAVATDEDNVEVTDEIEIEVLGLLD